MRFCFRLDQSARIFRADTASKWESTGQKVWLLEIGVLGIPTDHQSAMRNTNRGRRKSSMAPLHYTSGLNHTASYFLLELLKSLHSRGLVQRFGPLLGLQQVLDSGVPFSYSSHELIFRIWFGSKRATNHRIWSSLQLLFAGAYFLDLVWLKKGVRMRAQILDSDAPFSYSSTLHTSSFSGSCLTQKWVWNARSTSPRFWSSLKKIACHTIFG